MEDELHLPTAFAFAVGIGKSGVSSGTDNSFQEVSGIEQKIEIQPVREGGENRFEYQLPNGVKQQPLVLKRGVADAASPLIKWCTRVLGDGLLNPIALQNVQICLLDAEREPLRVWWLYNAYPVKWSVDPFSSTKNDVAIENIELAYQYIERIL